MEGAVLRGGESFEEYLMEVNAFGMDDCRIEKHVIAKRKIMERNIFGIHEIYLLFILF